MSCRSLLNEAFDSVLQVNVSHQLQQFSHKSSPNDSVARCCAVIEDKDLGCLRLRMAKPIETKKQFRRTI